MKKIFNSTRIDLVIAFGMVDEIPLNHFINRIQYEWAVDS